MIHPSPWGGRGLQAAFVAVLAVLVGLFIGRAAWAGDSGAWNSLWAAIQERSHASPPVPAACLEDGPPVQEGHRVLFRCKTSGDVRSVSLAADFNRWADNRGGRLTTNRFSMHSAGQGRWFRWEDLPAGSYKYKFVMEMPDGSFQWTKDPQVAESDSKGHTLLTVAAAPRPSVEASHGRMESFLANGGQESANGVKPLTVRVQKVWVRPGEGNVLRVRIPTAGKATVRIRTPTGRTVHESHYDTLVGEAELPVPSLPTAGGYLAEVEVSGPDGGSAAGTAVLTVAESIADDIRYGFYAVYDAPGGDNAAAAARLADLHVNAVEFYDYFPAHGHYAPRDESYVFEPFGIRISGRDVRGKIDAGHVHNMLAIAYVAAYAASRSVFEKHPFPMTDASGAAKIFNGRVTTEVAADAKCERKWFWLMNIADDSPWHEHILGEFARALDDGPHDIVSFDGFELDTYGDASDATFHATGSRRDGDLLVDVLHDFVGDVRNRARQVKAGAIVSFNSVNEFGAEAMSDVTDFAFLELWRQHTPWLSDIVEICHRHRGPRRQRVVLKLYPADMVPKQTAWPPGSLARILGAAMTGGGSLMVVGQPDAANGVMHGLNTLFYPDNKPLVSGNEELVRAYYRHDALWFGYTHGPDVHNTAIEAVAEDCLTRTYAAPDHSALVVQLLRRSDDGRWTTPATLPEPVKNLTLSIPRLTDAVPREVLYSSPDRERLARPSPVEFTADAEKVLVCVPELAVHGTVVLRY